MSFQFYFINLDRSTERLKSFLKEASFHPDIQFQRFSALVGSVDNPLGLPAGAHGCSLSHFQILKNFLNTDSEYAVILEDDIILSCNFSTTILELPSKLKEDWGIVWLGQTLNCHNWGGRPQPEIYEYNETFLTCSYPLGSFGYLVNRRGAKEILIEKKKFIFYDEELLIACKRGKFPQLILKEPLVYANVWVDSTIENNSLTYLHENADLNLYRRDFELNLLARNSDLLKHFNVEHLFICRPPNDLNNEIILSHFEKYKQDFKMEHLEPLRTYKQPLVTEYIAEDIKYFGRGLYYLRGAPLTVYIREDKYSEQIPRLPLINYVKKPLKINQEVYVQITQYHYLSRWQFLEIYNNVTHVGHRCFDFPIKNYFYQGNKQNKMIMKNYIEYLNLYSRYGRINIKFNFLRHLNEYVDENDSVKSLTEQLKYQGPTIAFTANPNPLFTKQLNIAKPFEYPDILVTHSATRFQGKNNILHLNTPTTEIFSDYNIIVNCRKRSNRLDNEFWVPLFMTNIVNMNDIDEIRVIKSREERLIEVVCLRDYKSIQGYEIIKDKPAKFIIVLERFNLPGYISEDIILAYANGSIPIYIGCKEVLEFFNSNTFIYLQSVDDLMTLPAIIDQFDYFNAFNHSIWKNGIPQFTLPW